MRSIALLSFRAYSVLYFGARLFGEASIYDDFSFYVCNSPCKLKQKTTDIYTFQ